jgi:glutathione S-transferase
MNLKFYYAVGACSLVAHAGLEAVGAKFEAVSLSLKDGQTRTPEYMQLNPRGQVPLLIADGVPLAQNMAIADFLDRKFPEAQLFPAEPMQRAQSIAQFAHLNNAVHPTFTRFFRSERFTSEAGSADVRAHAAATYKKQMEELQKNVQDHAKPFFGGAQASFADFYSWVVFRWAGFAGIDQQAMPALFEYCERVAATPAMARALEREGLTGKLLTYKPA